MLHVGSRSLLLDDLNIHLKFKETSIFNTIQPYIKYGYSAILYYETNLSQGLQLGISIQWVIPMGETQIWFIGGNWHFARAMTFDIFLDGSEKYWKL